MINTKIEFKITQSFIIDKEKAQDSYLDYVNFCNIYCKEEYKNNLMSFRKWLFFTLTEDDCKPYPEWIEVGDSLINDVIEYEEEDE